MRSIMLGAALTLVTLGAADAAIQISTAKIEDGQLVISGRVAKANEKVTFDGRFDTMSRSNRRFTWKEVYHPADCTVTVKSADEEREVVIANCGQAGPKGDKGDAGPQGAAGPKGDTGPAGTAGTASAAGPKGEAGPKGDPGAKGEAGPQGEPGPAAKLSIGTVTTGPKASATITGSAAEPVLNLVLPSAPAAQAAATPAATPVLRAVTATCEGKTSCEAACDAGEALLTATPAPTEQMFAKARWSGDGLPSEARIVCGKLQ